MSVWYGRETSVSLDENSLLWRYVGDRRFVMAICRAVSLQMLHPSTAAATHEFSMVQNRVYVHKRRTTPCIIRSAYEDDFDAVRRIRYSHDHFHGRRPDGRRYHALNPEVFLFEHATYVDEALATELDPDPGLRWYREQLLRPDYWYFRALPTPAVRAIQHPVAAGHLGLTPSRSDRRVLATTASMLRTADRVAPAHNIWPGEVRAKVLAARRPS
ncbi:oxygenase MpaB family protein [Gordonia sp. ABKF26]|uniref:oxygenase MpaB family protein n=1 Tax=Gordonia sp. ABKF26 TaxID=3238687 RepID=UPI0034E3A9F1